jgi:hypothetical protein
MASPDHIAYLGAAHSALMPKLHAGVLAAFEEAGGGRAPLHPLQFQVGQGQDGGAGFGRRLVHRSAAVAG